MITVESLVIVLFVIVTLLTMGVWGCIRIIIGLKMERNIVIRQLKLARDTGDDLRRGHLELSTEHLALTREKDEQDAQCVDMNAKLCLAQDRLSVAVSELGEAQQGWKECSEQLDTESFGLGTAHDTIELQHISIAKHLANIDELKAHIIALEVELAGADENVKVGKRFIKQLEEEIAGDL